MSETVDDRSVDLAGRVPGQTVMAEVLRLQEAARPRSRVQAALGRSPVVADAESWFRGALGEREVGRRLARLGTAWRVLHAVPVGTRGSDIDHVVLGPAGVITINTKNHAGRTVWVAGRTFLVDGQRQPHLRNAEHEARRVAEPLEAALGRPVPVRSAVVVVDPASLTVREAPPSVAVTTDSGLVRWLERLPVVLWPEEVAAVAAVAARPGTWQRRPDAAGADPLPAFERLLAEVAAARRTRAAWSLGAGAAAMSVAGASLWHLLG